MRPAPTPVKPRIAQGGINEIKTILTAVPVVRPSLRPADLQQSGDTA